MFNELVAATIGMIQDPNFVPYNQNIYNRENQFELYINNLIIQNLGNNLYSRNTIPGNGGRRFDIKRNYGDVWRVCEIGHNKSTNGYLENVPGLLNKIFDGYIQNYRNTILNIESYTLLYFSLEEGYDINSTNHMFETIMNLFPNKNRELLPVIFANELKGMILIIDSVENEEEAINIFRQNPHVHQYLRNIPQHWN
jgi:hypothetical protein